VDTVSLKIATITKKSALNFNIQWETLLDVLKSNAAFEQNRQNSVQNID
jgi:hypothetical protein